MPSVAEPPAEGVLRTADEAFVGLPGFDLPPSYVNLRVRGLPLLRMHYLDLGDPDGEVVLLLHGQPTWSYLYRHVIPPLLISGLRVIAPDHIGFGRSDKLCDPTAYSVERHIDLLEAFLDVLGLDELTLVAQDWGGPIGLGVLERSPDRFRRVVAANTVLHGCDPALAGQLAWANHGDGAGHVIVEEALVNYKAFFARSPVISPGAIVAAVAGPLTSGVAAAYDAPFPTPAHMAGLRQLTALIPISPSDPGAEIARRTMAALRSFEHPFLTAYSDGDPATAGFETVFQRQVPGARGQRHVSISGAGHFLQEQRGPELAAVIASFISETAR